MEVADKIGLLPGFGWVAGHNLLVTLLICWGLTPFGHLLVGFVGESRLVPISPRYQFLSFFPGDLFLGAMAAGLLVLAQNLPAEQHVYNSTWWHVLVFIGGCAVAVGLTWMEYKSGAYPARAILSPTKFYHNGLLYAGYGYIIVTTLVAVLASARSWWLVPVLLPGLVWVFFLYKDNTYQPEDAARKARHAHVENWSPLWARLD